MFKSAKLTRAQKSEPDIWSEGKQYVPLEMRHLGRVAMVISRRKAADLWGKASTATSSFALAVEDGFGAGGVARLGTAARILPARGTLVSGLARVSRLEAQASAQIDHQTAGTAPLEVGDLSLYMAQRRADMQELAQATQRQEQLVPTAPDRVAVVARRVVRHPTVPVPADAQVAAPVLAEPIPDVAMAELLAIRSALAAIPEPPPEPVALRPAPTPAPRSYPAAEKFDWTASETAFDWASPLPDPAPTKASPKAGLVARGLGAVWSLLRFCARLISRMAHAALRMIWRLIGPHVTKASAGILGWGLTGALLPYGIYAAVDAHVKGQDLRYFD